MPSIIRSFLLALNAMAFITLSDFSRPVSFALASPLSMSPPITRSIHQGFNNLGTLSLNANYRPGATSVPHPVAYSRIERLEYRKTSGQFLALQKYYHKANTHAKNLKSLAIRSSTVGENDHMFQQDCASQLTEFNNNVLGFQKLLGEMSSGKGLTFYDRTNDLESLLKNFVNTNKSVLDAISRIVNNLPILGPILGPIVYELKCILDDILNFCENLSDAVINALQPLLQSLLGKPSMPGCNGVMISGLCI
ncbi:hypothetical protein BDZ94DRAFT_399513 [Collybia nuda]|uniref:Uncharacterized protein n=1 Tax=Collybia nuda TaxID=64659 RepID=A0A9P5XTD6_9AGAR|nr:hypothetical protein BDZ94DRAFT_399513 [Collybia nuda]